MPIKYIGRTTNFKGKPLWEILGNLKDFGLGRIVVRTAFERYPEPSYLKICKVEPLPNQDGRKVRVQVEKVFRGRLYPYLTELCSVSYKADYRLIPKDEEKEYCTNTSVEQRSKVLPQSIPFPPLFRELILRDLSAKGIPKTEEPQLRLKYRRGPDNIARVVEEGEKPSVTFTKILDNPVSPELYPTVLK